MSLTQNLSGCVRVYPTASKSQGPKLPAPPPIRPITVMCAPTPHSDGRPTRNIPVAPRRREVQHYGSMSDFTSAEEEHKAREGRIQRRTDELLSSLVPYIGHDGTVVKGVWSRPEKED